ncbi:MAG: hypothetical protein KJ634_08890 [Gammaproteobacteria bacterium]|nr:hypothetical protein [Gammaproteobacteria bacterium]MBU1415722.1 hypothetical protein [Gammaproteobacteria bacterium]
MVAPTTDLDGQKAWCHVMYALHGISALGGVLGPATIVGSFLFGWPSIIAVIINYVTRGNVTGTWLESHWRWQLRTFWIAAAWALGAVVLFFTFIGIPFALLIIAVLGLWLLYRVIRGWLALLDKRTMPLPD